MLSPQAVLLLFSEDGGFYRSLKRRQIMKLKGLENFLFLKKKWLSPGELFLPWHCFEQAQIRGNAHLGPLFLPTLCIPLRWLGALPFPTSSQGTTLHVCRSQTTKQAFLLLEWDKWRSFFVCLCFVLVFFFFFPLGDLGDPKGFESPIGGNTGLQPGGEGFSHQRKPLVNTGKQN